MLEELVNKVFSNFEENVFNMQCLSERSILAPLLKNVAFTNHMFKNMMPVPATNFYSVNTAVSDEDSMHYPTEFLNSIELAGLPLHILTLKVGMRKIIRRNLNPPQIINGTRCTIIKVLRNVLEVNASSGLYKHENHLIPRIILQPADTQLRFPFTGKHFLVRPCFAITINKAKGQSLAEVGLDLRTLVFTHGMLYQMSHCPELATNSRFTF
ncbi:hypothetical protein ElyMa_003234800 [Elysia marginata]|uniref:DNA helicase Pif1-like 2B domain-containing protein n=1 Tax=Elysia marginata TaxID=1093978 RepID=A0AAV4J3H5_9GAST|nr:hypothetical protein ElyMa_003234800 [Elysia marginata]